MFRRIATAAFAAASIAFAVAPAMAMEPLLAKLADVDTIVSDSITPTYGCYDPTDKDSCQQVRSVAKDDGYYSTVKFANGASDKCFRPSGALYKVCVGDLWVRPMINNGHGWAEAPMFDDRCTVWGGSYSADYLACVAALPPK